MTEEYYYEEDYYYDNEEENMTKENNDTDTYKYNEQEDYIIEEDKQTSASNTELDLMEIKDNNLDKTFIIIKPENLEAIRNKTIKDCSEFTFTTPDESIAILVDSKWNFDYIQDNWYNDIEAFKAQSGLINTNNVLKELKQQGVYSNNDFCFICYNDFKGFTKIDIDVFSNNINASSINIETTYFSLSCCHNFCTECWLEYLNERLNDVNTVLNTKCPQKGCNLILFESIIKALTKLLLISSNSNNNDNKNKNKDNEDLLAKLNKAIYKNFTDKNKEIRWCPNPFCDLCVKSTSYSGNAEVTCPCSTIFCFSCGKEAHKPCSCKMIERWEEKNSSESENLVWLIANTKKCPKCKKTIEKNQGCNHMICPKVSGGCGHHFCWICLGDWKEHGNNYFNCNYFNPELKQNKDIKEQEDKAKEQNKRLEHYFSRYMNHNKAQKYAIKLKKKIKKDVNDFISIKKLQLEEVAFLNTAVDVIIASRMKLKNTYIFGFYFSEKCKENEKMLFEHHQYLLEKDADLLHELMENSSIESLLNIENFLMFQKEFNLFRSNITNLFTATLKYMNNIIKDIEVNLFQYVIDC